jgi:UDP-3-O-[3-hydroxymyristoyl] glucosamine N-acyltransferase
MKQHQQKAQYTLAEIIEHLPSELEVTIQGDPNYIVQGVCTIQEARPDSVAFLVNHLYRKYLPTTKAGAVILSPSDAVDCPTNAIISSNPYVTYAKIAKFFDPRSTPKPGIHPSAVIGEGCQIAASASIAAKCVIGDNVTIAEGAIISPGCVLGDYCEVDEYSRLDANVTLYDRIQIGKRVIIGSGTVIGSDGFGIAKHKGVWHKVPQLGRVIIQDDVEIGANCAIDRGAIDHTLIEKGVKLDNLIQVGHNVVIGEHTAIAGCTGIAGSAVIGKNCIIGGNAGFAGHITVADNVMVTGKTEVTKSIREPGVYSSGVGGLTTNLEWKKNTARVQRLDHLIQRVKALEALLNNNSSTSESEKEV